MEDLKVNLFPKKIWSVKQNRIYTRALSIECPKAVQKQVQILLPKITMSSKFRKTYPLTILVPYSRAIRAIRIDPTNFIEMQNNMLHYTCRYSLYNVISMEEETDHDEMTLREAIITKTPKLANGKSSILHITKGQEENEIVFSFDGTYRDEIESFLRNIDENLK